MIVPDTIGITDAECTASKVISSSIDKGTCDKDAVITATEGFPHPETVITDITNSKYHILLKKTCILSYPLQNFQLLSSTVYQCYS